MGQGLGDFFTGYVNFGVNNSEMAVVLWSVLIMYLLPSIIATFVILRSWRRTGGVATRPEEEVGGRHRVIHIPVFHHRREGRQKDRKAA